MIYIFLWSSFIFLPNNRTIYDNTEMQIKYLFSNLDVIRKQSFMFI